MNKAKIFGVLLAAVIASVPATGLTTTVFHDTSNTIVAEAVSNYITVKPGYNSIIRNYGKRTVVLQNGNWQLIMDYNGDIYTYNTANGIRKYLRTIDTENRVHDFYNQYCRGSQYPGKGTTIKDMNNVLDYSIYFQGDGNMVAYNKGDTGQGLWHSYTYFGSSKRRDAYLFMNYSIYKVQSYSYELTSNGNVEIWSTVKNIKDKSTKSYNIWRSDKDCIYRIV